MNVAKVMRVNFTSFLLEIPELCVRTLIKSVIMKVECVEKFKYLGVTVTNTNYTSKEIKRRINMGNACYYSLEKILSSCPLSIKLKVQTYKTIILPVILYGC